MTSLELGCGLGVAFLIAAALKARADGGDGPTPPSGVGDTFAYATQDGKMNKTARYDGDEASGRMTFVAAGALQNVVCQGIHASPPRAPPTNYAYARDISTVVATMAYVVLYALQHWGYDFGTELHFTLDGRDFVGKLEVHNDGPGGPRPFDHPGVDLFERVA